MSQPGAKQGDHIIAIDTHVILIPSPAGPVPTPTMMPFDGVLVDNLASSVLIEDKPVATVGSVGKNLPPHIPSGGPFQKPPSNEGTVQLGSTTVLVDDKGVARNGDVAVTCNDPADAPQGTVIATGTVLVG